MIGGSDLARTKNQTYSYFLVRNQGEFYIANREGDKRPIAVMNWTANPAIVKQGDDGKQTNSLAIQVQGDNVIFSVNGTEVSRQPKRANFTPTGCTASASGTISMSMWIRWRRRVGELLLSLG